MNEYDWIREAVENPGGLNWWLMVGMGVFCFVGLLVVGVEALIRKIREGRRDD